MKRALILLFLLLLSGAWVFAQDNDPAEFPAKGLAIFREAGGMGYSACHGEYALGDLQIGPNIRGVDETRIHGALDTLDVMAFLVPLLSDDDISAVAEYLQYLGTLEPVSITLRRSTFDPSEVTVPTGTAVQLIINNRDRAECTFTIDGAGLEPTVLAGRAMGNVVWTTPAEAASFVALCNEKPDQLLTVTVEQAGD